LKEPRRIADASAHLAPKSRESPNQIAKLNWLLERNHSTITACLAARDTVAESLPPLPASLKLFLSHLILVTIDAIRRRQQELGIPDDVSWETLSLSLPIDGHLVDCQRSINKKNRCGYHRSPPQRRAF